MAATAENPAPQDETPSADLLAARRLQRWIFVLVLLSLVSFLPQMRELMSGGRLTRDARVGDVIYLLSRLPREVLYLGVLGAFFRLLFTGRIRSPVTRAAVHVVAWTILWSLACFVYAVAVKELPVVVPVLGLKAFQFVPFLWVGYALARSHGTRLFLEFADVLRWYVLVLVATGVLQAAFGPGVRTILGARTFGPFTNMNAYGAALVTCGLWFLAARITLRKETGRLGYGPWLAACCLMSLTTGSRTAITLSLGLLLLAVLPRFGFRARIVLLATVLLATATLPFLISSRAITGRAVERSNETRLEIAREALDGIETVPDLLFGPGLGLYSKATVVLFGAGRFPGQVGNPHSTYLEILGGFGLVGLLGFLLLLGLLARRGADPEMVLFLGIAGLMALPNNLISLFPIDLLLLFLCGHLLGMGVAKSGRHSSASPSASIPPTKARAPD